MFFLFVPNQDNQFIFSTMINKQSYEAPEAELLEVKFEENILSEGSVDGSGFTGDGKASVNDRSSEVWQWM